MRRLFMNKPNRNRGGRALAHLLGARLLRNTNSRYVSRPEDIVINWGGTYLNGRCGSTRFNTLNEPVRVATASHKLNSFEAFRSFNGTVREGGTKLAYPAFTVDREVAEEWVEAGGVAVERHCMNGSGGAGIRLVACFGQFAITCPPLYTRYVKKNKEYRVHVLNGCAFYVQEKKRSHAIADEDVNWQIRSHDNGFIYATEDVEVPSNVVEQGVLAVKALGLDFGAVDIGYTHSGGAFVFEVNTAPGLEGRTLDVYAAAFGGYCEAYREALDAIQR